MSTTRKLIDNVLKIKKRVERVINIPPENFRRTVYLESNYPLVEAEGEESDTLNERIKLVVKAFNTLDQNTIIRIAEVAKPIIVKTFELINIDVIEDESQFEALIDEELEAEDDADSDLSADFTKTRLARSLLLISLVIMTVTYLDQPKTTAYVYMLFITLWFMIRLLERQLFDMSVVPTVRELLPWFCILLAVSAMLKKTVLDTFKHVVLKCREHGSMLYAILGVQVAQIAIRLSKWYKLVQLSGSTKIEKDKTPGEESDEGEMLG